MWSNVAAIAFVVAFAACNAVAFFAIAFDRAGAAQTILFQIEESGE